MKPVRVLYGIDGIGRGGTELQLLGLVERLDRSKFCPYLCTLNVGDESLLPVDCQHLELQLGSLFSARGLSQLKMLVKYLKDNRIDIVQTFFQDATLFIGLAARLAGVPVRLASFRDLGFWRTRRQEIPLRLIYRGMTGFLANSLAVKDHFCSTDNLDPNFCSVIYNGLDVSAFDYSQPAITPMCVGILGNLNRDVKRADLFVEAAGKLVGQFPEVRWEIVGDGHQREQLQKRAENLGLGNQLKFLGRLSNIGQVMQQWDVGVLCSDSEGFSNALLEYMLCGCAAVVTDTGGNSEAVEDRKTGLLVPVDNAEALAGAIAELLSDGELAVSLAGAARSDAVERFSWETCVNAYEELYRNKMQAI